MSDQTQVKSNRWRRWNPFQRFENADSALSAAKCGTWVAGYLALSYLLQSVLLYTSHKDTYGNAGAGPLVADIVMIVVAVFLGWRIHVRQPVWAELLVAAWFALELWFKAVAIASGEQTTNAGWIVMLASLACGAVLGVRGSLKLRRLTRPRSGLVEKVRADPAA